MLERGRFIVRIKRRLVPFGAKVNAMFKIGMIVIAIAAAGVLSQMTCVIGLLKQSVHVNSPGDGSAYVRFDNTGSKLAMIVGGQVVADIVQ